MDSSRLAGTEVHKCLFLKNEVLKGFGGDGEAVAAKPVGDGGAEPPSGRMRATGARPSVLASPRGTLRNGGGRNVGRRAHAQGRKA
jgi:hypothetical protein